MIEIPFQKMQQKAKFLIKEKFCGSWNKLNIAASQISLSILA